MGTIGNIEIISLILQEFSAQRRQGAGPGPEEDGENGDLEPGRELSSASW